MFQKVLYAIFLGFLVCMFVVWAMAAWFPTPQWENEYPGVERHLSQPIPPSTEELNFLSPEEREIRIQEYEADRAEYREWEATHMDMEEEFGKKMEAQGMTVALISLLIAVVITAVCLVYSGRLQVIAEGLLLGGIFTLIYSIGWCFIRAPKIAVVSVGIGLVVTIILGYIKFVKNAPDAKKPEAA
jgi:hypothetical protein